MRSKQWQQAVQERLETLREQVRQEPEIDEALARLQQRARVEGWAEEEPALGLVRKVERLRTRLKQTLTSKRLDIPVDPQARLAERLAALERILARTLAPPFSPEERVLHQGDILMNPALAFLLLIGVIVSLFVCMGLVRLTSSWLLFVLMLLLPPLWHLLERHRVGRFWLTGTRLVLKLRGRAAIHIPLDAIRPGGVRLCPLGRIGIGLVDGRSIRLGFTEDAEQFLTLLRQHHLALPRGESLGT